MTDKPGPPPMPGQPPKMPKSAGEGSGPPPMPILDAELSVESAHDDVDALMTPMPQTLLIHLSIAAVMVIVGLVIPKAVIFIAPVFTLCGF